MSLKRSFIHKLMETTVPCLVLWFLSFCHRSRSPPDQIPFATQSDSVRHPIGFRTVNDDLHRHIAQKKNIIKIYKSFVFQKLLYIFAAVNKPI